MDSTQMSSPSTSTYSEWLKEKQELEAKMKQQEVQMEKQVAQMEKQAEMIEQIQSDLQEKISLSHDLQEQLAQAIELAHSRDMRHEEMMAKFDRLMQMQESQMTQEGTTTPLATIANSPSTPSRSSKPNASPPTKRANTNASPNRTVYAVFRQPIGKTSGAGKTSFMGTYLKNHRPHTTSPLRLMDTDEGTPPPPPGAKSGKKTE